MKDNLPLFKFFLTSVYTKPKQSIVQVLLILAFIYIALQYCVFTFIIYFVATSEVFLFYSFILSNSITYILISYFAISVVFSQSDFSIFAHLPISAKRIVMAKIVSSVALPISVVGILSIPTFFILLIEFNIGFAIKSIVFLLMVNIFITLSLLCVLSILNHFRTIFMNIAMYLMFRMTLILGIGICPIVYFWINNVETIKLVLAKIDTSTIASLSASISDILDIGYRFAMQQQWLEGILPLTAAQSVLYFSIVFLLCFLLFNITITIIASKYYEYGSAVNRIEKTAKVWGKNTSWSNYLQREYWIIQSEPYFKLQAMLGVIMAPIGTVIYLMVIQMNMLKAEWIVDNKAYLFVYMILFMSCMNNISGTPYSREGKYYASSKTLPLEPHKIFMAKVVISSSISALSVIISYIFYMLFEKNDMIMMLYLLITLLLVFSYNLLSPLYDKRHPLLDWTNPSEAIKSNPTVLISLLYGLPLLIIIALLHFGLLTFHVSPRITAVIILIIVTISTITIFYKNRKGYVNN
ncbi:hypothetical protein [Lysinibacillus pakistanensis]|uniref:ABC transporter permease n=1 Tax=Lysinibacillus pakistanensis TaxID=759811 RepID=A0AAX3WYM9_9BACI|nr:hypothetical protein [Lysinibacillus pakistanensis]MDM5232508.1 hypothetical protein [Lysinibacillus pakistanensis]WHY48018.1 hypothetical protein QNH22_07255 [Lysinibacillus pakistanensis]WHY53030.1 hypothetical protein QNH24_07240 [Lysinibacillus pakistanensis]